MTPLAFLIAVLLFITICWAVKDKLQAKGNYKKKQQQAIDEARAATDELKEELSELPEERVPRSKPVDKWHHQKDSADWF